MFDLKSLATGQDRLYKHQYLLKFYFFTIILKISLFFFVYFVFLSFSNHGAHIFMTKVISFYNSNEISVTNRFSGVLTKIILLIFGFHKYFSKFDFQRVGLFQFKKIFSLLSNIIVETVFFLLRPKYASQNFLFILYYNFF